LSVFLCIKIYYILINKKGRLEWFVFYLFLLGAFPHSRNFTLRNFFLIWWHTIRVVHSVLAFFAEILAGIPFSYAEIWKIFKRSLEKRFFLWRWTWRFRQKLLVFQVWFLDNCKICWLKVWRLINELLLIVQSFSIFLSLILNNVFLIICYARCDLNNPRHIFLTMLSMGSF